MTATTIVAIVGILASGLGGHFLQARLKERGDRLGKLSEARTALFVEAMAYAQREEAWLEWIQTPFRQKADFPDASRVEVITGKMGLFAPVAVQDGWRHLLNTSQQLKWYLEDEFVGGEERVVPDVPPLLAVRDAIALLRRDMREALGIPED